MEIVGSRRGGTPQIEYVRKVPDRDVRSKDEAAEGHDQSLQIQKGLALLEADVSYDCDRHGSSGGRTRCCSALHSIPKCRSPPSVPCFDLHFLGDR